MTKEQKKIIVVDDNDTNLVACKNILKPYYIVYPAPSAAKMFDLIEHITPDLILLDVEMPDISGYEAAKTLKSSDTYRRIPLIFISGRSDPMSEAEGLTLGALDYIHKPFTSALLLKRIEIHLSFISCKSLISHEIQNSLNEIIGNLNTALGADDTGIVKENLDRAAGVSKHLLANVNNMLDM